MEPPLRVKFLIPEEEGHQPNATCTDWLSASAILLLIGGTLPSSASLHDLPSFCPLCVFCRLSCRSSLPLSYSSLPLVLYRLSSSRSLSSSLALFGLLALALCCSFDQGRAPSPSDTLLYNDRTPHQIEIDIHVKLSTRQRSVYEALLANISVADLLEKATNIGDANPARSLMNLAMQFCKVRWSPLSWNFSRFTHTFFIGLQSP